MRYTARGDGSAFDDSPPCLSVELHRAPDFIVLRRRLPAAIWDPDVRARDPKYDARAHPSASSRIIGLAFGGSDEIEHRHGQEVDKVRF